MGIEFVNIIINIIASLLAIISFCMGYSAKKEIKILKKNYIIHKKNTSINTKGSQNVAVGNHASIYNNKE